MDPKCNHHNNAISTCKEQKNNKTFCNFFHGKSLLSSVFSLLEHISM